MISIPKGPVSQLVRLPLCVFKRFILRFNFRSKPKHALHQPLHGEKKHSQNFSVDIIEQKEGFQKVQKSRVYDKTQQIYDFFYFSKITKMFFKKMPVNV